MTAKQTFNNGHKENFKEQRYYQSKFISFFDEIQSFSIKVANKHNREVAENFVCH